jgi:hypothetical protein
MKIYYANLQAMEQQTMALFNERCHHCNQSHQLISHGCVYKKQSMAEPKQKVGKRVFCSNRGAHTGCGRTMQLYLDSTVRYLHYWGRCVVSFVLALMMNMTIQQAYQHATGTAEPRHAYRWLQKLSSQLSAYRSLLHQPILQPVDAATCHPRRGVLAATFTALLHQFGQPLCGCYQRQLQRSFL